ncbi:MAG: TolB family protein [Anaerolineales bacterium]
MKPLALGIGLFGAVMLGCAGLLSLARVQARADLTALAFTEGTYRQADVYVLWPGAHTAEPFTQSPTIAESDLRFTQDGSALYYRELPLRPGSPPSLIRHPLNSAPRTLFPVDESAILLGYDQPARGEDLLLQVRTLGINNPARLQYADAPRAVAWPGVEPVGPMPALSPDGARLAFVAQSEDQSRTELHIAGPGGTVAHADAPPPFLSRDFPLLWSPSGDWVAFGGYTQAEQRIHIYLASADGGRARQLSDGSARDVPWAWSPDGDWVYFLRMQAPGNTQADLGGVYRARADGGTPPQNLLHNPGGPVSAPGWLYFSTGMVGSEVTARVFNQQYGIYRMRTNGADVTRVIETQSGVGRVVASPPLGRRWRGWPLGVLGIASLAVAVREWRRV